MAWKKEYYKKAVIAIYFCMFQASIILTFIALMNDTLVVVEGAFRTESKGLLSVVTKIIPWTFEAELTTSNMILYLHSHSEEDDTYLTYPRAPYSEKCEQEPNFIRTEEDIERQCRLQFSGKAFKVGAIAVMVLSFIASLILILRGWRWRYFISFIAFINGFFLVCVEFLVEDSLQNNDCAIRDYIIEKTETFLGGVGKWLFIGLTNEDRWCFSHESSWLNAAKHPSLDLTLAAGIIMLIAGCTYWIVMTYIGKKFHYQSKKKKKKKKNADKDKDANKLKNVCSDNYSTDNSKSSSRCNSPNNKKKKWKGPQPDAGDIELTPIGKITENPPMNIRVTSTSMD